jgi:hypothetical protein
VPVTAVFCAITALLTNNRQANMPVFNFSIKFMMQKFLVKLYLINSLNALECKNCNPTNVALRQG